MRLDGYGHPIGMIMPQERLLDLTKIIARPIRVMLPQAAVTGGGPTDFDKSDILM